MTQHSLARPHAQRTTEWKPRICDVSGANDASTLQEIMQTSPAVVDTFAAQLKELFCVDNPIVAVSADLESAFAAFRHEREQVCEEWRQGRWVYYPWLHALVHVLEDAEFQRVRMARNRELVTREEQDAFYNSTVGIGGLSIGNSIAVTLALSGGCRHIKLADFDTLDLSNMNRVRTGVVELGSPKTIVTARQVYEINPYADVEIFDEGLNEKNIASFLHDLDVMVDELDNLAVKCLVRNEARKYKIPVVMAADCADAAIVDIERYDLDPDLPIFHGRLGDVSYESLQNLSKRDTGALIGKHIGLENHTPAMLHSLQHIGTAIVSWPQLGSTAVLNGAALTYCIRNILIGRPAISDRSVISFDALLGL